jgi:acyl carrier protein
MNDLNKKLAEILEVQSVDDADTLKEFDEWDSLTSLSMIAMIDADYNVNLTAEELVSLTTVGDLKNYIKSKMS